VKVAAKKWFRMLVFLLVVGVRAVLDRKQNLSS
jgi:hypothetical protein